MTNIDDKLKRVGKRMPYVMPNDLFGRMQKQVMSRMDEADKKRKARRHRNAIVLRLSVAATAIAASACLLLVLRFGNVNDGGSGTASIRQTTSDTSMEKAYNNLSQKDRENLIADYKYDIYMSLQ